ncbi:hypothetical protein [Rubinisphaera sp. JC750]|uniref:hypothetical protein n=1 Tax=Rubinisphaera sp. JC750 TaxID=2898658 RepID=UPI001F238C24|nr:hypothetical protein [Rubinisphaera sp. JC750]
MHRLLQVGLVLMLLSTGRVFAEDLLFEETFDQPLSDAWQIKGLAENDYRVCDGALEVRVKPAGADGEQPRLLVNLPFSTGDMVIASVEVTVAERRLQRGEMAGMSLIDADGSMFRVRKTNVDGYFVMAPGQPEFIGPEGEEGDPLQYTVKYWPAQESAGPLRIIVRGHYAHFQTGPDDQGKFRNYFHSAIRESKTGLGFALFVQGLNPDNDCWIRFDNFRVVKP